MNKLNPYVNEALLSHNRQITKFPVKDLQDLKRIISEKYKENPKHIDLNSYDISNLTDLSYAFSHCSETEEISIEFWDVSQVLSMEAMFFECESLKKIDICHWDVKKLNTTNSMFFGCKSLVDLDLSKWSCYNLHDMDYMFFKCSKLENLKFIETYILDLKKISTQNMFKGCFTLSRNKKLPIWY